MIVMIDLGLSNSKSVRKAFERVGAHVDITDRPEELERAEAVILPGVGAFGNGMSSIHEKGLFQPLLRHAREKKKPLLGICLGMQLLADSSEEHGPHQGLGLIAGNVVRLTPRTDTERVPNMGWCDTKAVKQGKLFDHAEIQAFYFAHSYHVQCADSSDVAASIEYGGCEVLAALERENLFGVQFHPEKSQDAGLEFLERFVRSIERFAVC